MNKPNPSHEVIVSGIHLDLTPSMKAYVQEKMERLFRHEERIMRIRVDLECDTTKIPSEKFSAKGRIEIYGPDIIASVIADDSYKTVDMLVDKLDNMIRKRAGGHKDSRNHPKPIEWSDVGLPKTI